MSSLVNADMWYIINAWYTDIKSTLERYPCPWNEETIFKMSKILTTKISWTGQNILLTPPKGLSTKNFPNCFQSINIKPPLPSPYQTAFIFHDSMSLLYTEIGLNYPTLILYLYAILLYCIILYSEIYMIQPPILHLPCFHLIVCMMVKFSRYHVHYSF